MEPLIQQLLDSPSAALQLQRVQAALAEEHERRLHFYAEVTEGQKAEFINGEVIVHSPAKKRHQDASGRLFTLLKAHVQRHGLGWVGFEKVMLSLTRNDYEPDVCFFTSEKAAAFTPDQMHFPAPDLVAEVLSPSTARTDRGVKHEDYAAHGVTEYWLLDPEAETVEQFVLEGEPPDAAYTLRMKSASGEVESVAVAGFVVPIRALFDDAAHLETLRAVLA